MSHQEFSDGTLPDYFLNLWRKKFMTEEEIESEKKQLEKLYMTNSISISEKNEYNYMTKTENEVYRHVYHNPSN